MLADNFGRGVVFDTGNPWVNLKVPIPVPVDTHTRESRVWVFMGFPMDTGKGMLSAGRGTGIPYTTSII